eukprot:3976840-Pleurochrysis_carterae.AAC.1
MRALARTLVSARCIAARQQMTATAQGVSASRNLTKSQRNRMRADPLRRKRSTSGRTGARKSRERSVRRIV